MFDINIIKLNFDKLLILKQYIFNRLNAQTCFVEIKINRSNGGKTYQKAKLIKIIFRNKKEPSKIQKIVAFHYKNILRKILHKSNMGPIDITRRDSFPLSLEPWQDYHLYLTSTDFCGDIPTDGYLLFKIYPHLSKPITKILNLSREKIEWNINTLKKGETIKSIMQKR